jgi:hypothetical protein
MNLLAGHGDAQCFLGRDYVGFRLCGVGDGELNTFDSAVERVFSGLIVGRHGRAAIASDVAAVIGGIDDRQRGLVAQRFSATAD